MDSIKKWSDDKGGNRKDQIDPVSDKLIQALNSQFRSSKWLALGRRLKKERQAKKIVATLRS
jgi:hypothetical protein